ncbi:hypothetical protein V6N11_032062 [Hibiscus sabdariffa]|uniref:Uncharacterized protein n=1 Tax=Hibiscus sabdariffa TaxID=183260 RepID=A0ABR2SZP2_9ROSI
MFSGPAENTDQHDTFVKQHAQGYWRKAAVVSWTVSLAVFGTRKLLVVSAQVILQTVLWLRGGFIRAHCSGHPEFDFHKYMMRTLEVDFKKIVGISVMVQVVCSHITLPLYALVTQVDVLFHASVMLFCSSEKGSSTGRNATQIDRIAKESNESLRTEEQATISVVSQGFQYYLPVFLEKF